jgi:hypothetical protein
MELVLHRSQYDCPFLQIFEFAFPVVGVHGGTQE